MKTILSYFFFIVLVCSACVSTKQSFSKRDVRSAQKVIGLEFSDDRIDTIYGYLGRNLSGYDSLRNYTLANDVMPALLFDPLPLGFSMPEGESCTYLPDNITGALPADDDLAFMTVAEQAALIKSGKLNSEYLTRLYIKRIKKYDPTLKAVITLLEEAAIENAKKADQEIANGNYKGPLHGIPYGVKDLVSVQGYPTTWGAMPYKDQVLDETATIVQRFEEAGAILIAKLTSGALARGDVWWGGKTVSPWDTLQGASGSSAGSGSATSAGLVGFSIGTETLGSITSPSTRNGVTGLRPTYGRVSRTGVMPLSWSMDKVGPICRSAEDCILVFQAIQGVDPKDPTLYDVPFCYDDDLDISSLRVGYLDSLFLKDTSEAMVVIRKAVDSLEMLGLEFIKDSLPEGVPFRVFDVILRAEAGAFFDDLVRSGQVDLMVQQGYRSRANSLRQSRFIPAVEYLNANRHRKVLIEKMNELMSKYDVIVSPTFGGTQLLTTNLTGHPVVTFPAGFDEKGHPVSLTLIGNLFEEAKILKLAKAFQEATKYDNYHPPLFGGQAPAINSPRAIPGHAHNDYEHKRPLQMALENGFTSVEADVHLINNELYVAHNKPSNLSNTPTLQELYLKPLSKRIKKNGGVIYPSNEGPFYLMIDVKSSASVTFDALQAVLSKYESMSSSNGGPVSFVISGNRAIDKILSGNQKLMQLDGRPADLSEKISAEKMPIVSQNYKKYLSWKGKGAIKPNELAELQDLVKSTHDQNKKLRLWASPENEEVWQFLIDNGVDIINTDKIQEFKKFYEEKASIQ